MRLISFLGKGKYNETTYSFENKTRRTSYVVHALASFIKPKEVYLIATDEAWVEHGASLGKGILLDIEVPVSNQLMIPTIQVRIPTGGDAQQLWQMFEVIVDVIGTSNCPVLLDITHGFRMQPFFAAACIQYIQSVLPNPPQIRVVYGEYRGPDHESPIWELTPFLEVLSWSRNIMLFLRTGQADGVVEPTEALGREMGRQWAMAGRQGAQPQLRTLSQALQAFSNDFTTIRTGSLLIGNQSSSQRLFGAIDKTSAEVAQQLPALALVLKQVQDMIEPLRTNDERLSSVKGQRALISLARLYQKMGRYSEAISILREGWITLNAPEGCDMPGTNEFNNVARIQHDLQWARRNGTNPDPVAELRNDIQHAGFTQQPHTLIWFEQRLENLLAEWSKAIDDMK